MEVFQWLQRLGFEEYTDSFGENRIDEEVLPLLTDEDLKTLGVHALGDRKKILKAIAELMPDAANEGYSQQRPQSTWATPKPTPKRRPSKPKPQQATPSEAERRQLTVMFCDLVGSTELSGKLDPEDLRDIMRQYQDTVAGCIARYDGYLAKFLGDGVLAYFGWPRAFEDQAERAIRAGLDAAAAVIEIDLSNGPQLHARVGIASGEVVVGDIVGEASSEVGAVVGKTPNLAARLESIAKPDQVVVGDETRQLVGDVFEYEDLGQHELKGIDSPAQSWRVLRERISEGRFEAAHRDEVVEFVGREHELGLLRDRWNMAKNGEGQVILLSGEAGIGKSRLIEALRAHIGGEELFRIQYQCSSHQTNTTFYPIIRRIEAAAGFAANDTSETKLDKLETLLKPSSNDITSQAPLIASMLSLSCEDRYGSVDLPPQQLRNRTIQAMVDQVLALSRRRPVLLFLEDAQWIDPSTEDYLGELIPLVTDKSVLMLITSRPGYTPPWAGHAHLTSLELSRLAKEFATEIVQTAGGHKLPDRVVERIVSRAEGVPLYLEELTKVVVDAGESVGSLITEDQIPATLQASLIARLDRLEDAKEIAQIGSILGREFSYELLAAVADKSDAEVSVALDRLVHSGMVFRRGVAPESIYTFKQSLLQDAAYATILISRRRRLHATIVEVLEAESDLVSNEKIELLAHHAFQGENWEKAFAYSRKAGLKAAKNSADREASALLEQALICLKNLPDSKENQELAIDTHYAARSAIQAFGEHERVVEHLREAEKLAATLEDQSRLGWASAYLSQYLWWTGEHDEAERLGQRALEIAPTMGDVSLEAVATFFLGQGFFNIGNYERAVDFLGRNEALLQGDAAKKRHGLTGLPAVLSHSWLAWSLCELGRFADATDHANSALSIAEDVNQPYSIATACLAIGQVQLVQGGPNPVAPILERALEACEKWGLDVIFPMAAELLGLAHALKGDVERSLELLQDAEAKSTSSRIFDTPVSAAALGTVYLLANRTEEAAEFASRDLELAKQRGFRGSEARMLHLGGEIAALREAPDYASAKKHYREAQRLAEDRSMRPLVADCSLGLGKLHRQNGNQQEADEFFATAEAMFREMEMYRQIECMTETGSKATV